MPATMFNEYERTPESAAKENHSALSQVLDFGQSALHSAVENPVNGIIQTVNHATTTHLPELNIVGAPERASTGAMLGAISGSALDFYVLNKVAGSTLGNIGGNGIGGAALRTAIVGGVYEGLLQPSDPNSKYFFRDRLTNGLVGAGTFAAMGAGSRALDGTGLFAVPEARSFMGSIAHGGLSGIAGGLAHAEATAIFKDGRVLASGDHFVSDGVRFGLFGAAYGAVGYGYNRITDSIRGTEVVKTNGGTLEFHKDAQGNPVGLKVDGTHAWREAADGEGTLLLRGQEGSWTGTKMSDGTWTTSRGSNNFDRDIPLLRGVSRAPGGTITMTMADGATRSFAPGGNYELSHVGEHGTSVSLSNGEHTLDTLGRITQLRNGPSLGEAITEVRYAKSGGIEKIELSGEQPHVTIKPSGPDTWTARVEDSIYKWEGKITSATGPGASSVNSLQFSPKGGKPALFSSSTGTQGLSEFFKSTGQFEAMAPSVAYGHADANGNVFLTGGKYDTPVVNGHKVPAGESVQVRPGDKVDLDYFIEDWNTTTTHHLQWGATPEGKPTLQGRVFEPNKFLDFGSVLRTRPAYSR